ncbi:uncharacterized protein LOC130815712 [Amaranthus tricolor]|uniref:uncharacterized protein LOC130815712 n=1 Tax=Amaranthus tricolor TaxID=29722 RepID=UPI0025865957|nr:uncharacterized protein LOC130815712 [Amaranthus tricolor]
MKKLTIRKKASDSKKKQSELSTEVGNVTVDEVLIDSSELVLANVDGNADEVEDSSDDDYTYDEELRLIVDKEVDEQNSRDIYFNDDEPHYPTFNPEVDFKGKINLCLGLKFPSTYVFRKALRYHAIECGYNYYYLHNGTNRISVYCYNRCDCMKSKGRIVNCVCGKEKKCYFKVHAMKLKDEETIQIRNDWRENPTWELKAFKKRVNRELGCEVNEEYSRVWDYAEAIRRFNPGSTAIVKCIGIDTPPPLFQRMYICLTACKEGFIAGCRPIIGVDGAHLKGKFPGVLLTAVGKDGNNNIFPIAWAVVETENVETWTWFLNLLVEDLRSVTASSSWVQAEVEAFTFMSDRQKGLVEALNSVVPECEIRFCCRHIWANFKIKFPGELFKQHFWSAARAYNKLLFLQNTGLAAKHYVHEAYLIDTYRKTYSPKFYGMPGHKMWPTSTLAKPLPPPYRKMPGRPNKRKRKKEVGEGKGGKKAVKEFKQRRCGNCGDLGHYKKGCKNPPKPPPTKTQSKGGRPKMGSSSTQQSTQQSSSTGQQQTQNAASTSCLMDQNSQI